MENSEAKSSGLDFSQITESTPLDEIRELVHEFHVTFGQPTGPAEHCTELTDSRRDLRLGLILEEFKELVIASGDYLTLFPGEKASSGEELTELIDLGSQHDSVPLRAMTDIVEMADALGDIVYVCYGMALEMGIDLDAVIREIHRANMSKLGADGKPIFRRDGKVLKGPNYRAPDIASVILF